MAATEGAPKLHELARVWYRFQELAEFRVMEGNTLAGERLWETVKSPDMAGMLTIRSTRRPAEYVECAVDPKTLLLTCKFGAGPPAALELQLGDSPATLDEALTQVLDHLVWAEEEVELAAVGSDV